MSHPGGGWRPSGRSAPVVQGKFLQAPASLPASRSLPQRPGREHPHAIALAAVPAGGAGQSLPADVRERMESLFRADFSAVRVHVGREAAQLSALAFTCGDNVFFAPQQYQPTTSQGLRLLGHELTHVVQQRSGRARNPLGSSPVLLQDPVLEAEAERMGWQAARILPPRPQPPRPGAAPAQARPAAPGLRTPRASAASPPRTPAPGPRRPTGVVQRLVYLISDDALTQGTYRNLTQIPEGHTDPTGSLRALDRWFVGLPFDQLGPRESLHLIIHGGGGSVEDMDPDQFVAYLIDRGLHPRFHGGTIRLVSCYSGTPSATLGGSTFVQRFTTALRQAGFGNAVIGFDGLVRAAKGGQILVIPPGQAAEFWRLSNLKDYLHEKWRELTARKPPPGTDELEVELYLLEVADFKGKFDKVVAKIEKLWVPQRLGQNLIHIPEARPMPVSRTLLDSYSREQEAKRWHLWRERQMRSMHLIKPGESARPLRDYSSSYIS